MSPSLRKLVLLHLVGNALLLSLGYYWLGVGESSGMRLAWSALVVAIFLCLTVWLHGTAFAYFGVNDFKAAVRIAMRNLLPLLAVAVAILIVYLLLAWWRNYSGQPAFKIASYLTLNLRKPVKPNNVLRVFSVVLWLVRWVILPVLFLPLAANIANKGWIGFRGGSWKLSKRWIYWLEVPLLLLCSFWIPFKLMGWVPPVGGFAMEMTSFLIRLVIAYLLFVGAWLVLAFVTSGGSPRASQPSSVDSP